METYAALPLVSTASRTERNRTSTVAGHRPARVAPPEGSAKATSIVTVVHATAPRARHRPAPMAFTNGDEGSVDCGGPFCGLCADTVACIDDQDCLSGECSFSTCRAPTCTDGRSNGDETGVDCGGPTCPDRCADGGRCGAVGDCISGQCTNGVCGTRVGCHWALVRAGRSLTTRRFRVS